MYHWKRPWEPLPPAVLRSPGCLCIPSGWPEFVLGFDVVFGTGDERLISVTNQDLDPDPMSPALLWPLGTLPPSRVLSVVSTNYYLAPTENRARKNGRGCWLPPTTRALLTSLKDSGLEHFP